jgi:ribosomal protein S4E
LSSIKVKPSDSFDEDINSNEFIIHNPDIKKIIERILFATHRFTMVSENSNNRRVGTIIHTSKLDRNFNVVILKDARGHNFNTRINQLLILGKIGKSVISLLKGNGFKIYVQEEPEDRLENEYLCSVIDWKRSNNLELL